MMMRANYFMILLLVLLAACHQQPGAGPTTTPIAASTATAGSEADIANQGDATAEEEQTTMTESARGNISSQSFHSATLDKEIAYNVYLPAGYDASEERYPVLYLLHGRGDSMDAWTIINSTLNQVIASGEIPPAIVLLL